MRAFHLLALSPIALTLAECGSASPSSSPTPDASTLNVPLAHLFDDDYGQLLYAQAVDGEIFSGQHLDYPEPALSRATSISAGGGLDFSVMGSPPDSWECAALPAGQLVCEGSNVDGALGAIATDSCYNECDSYGSTNLPKECDPTQCFHLFGSACYACVMDWTPLPGFTNLRQIHRGCGVDYAGNVTCWAGHVGKFPRPVRALEGTFAILDNGDLYSEGGASTPILQHVVQATSDDLLNDNSCALTDDTSIYCWGENLFGAVGNGTTTRADSPVLVGVGYRSVRTNEGSTCAIRTDDTVECWGNVYPLNIAADTGNCAIDTTCALTPTPVAVLSNVKEIAGLNYGFYALLKDGSVVQVSWPPKSPAITTIHTAQ